jgi:zinc transport system ATP-binding protein
MAAIPLIQFQDVSFDYHGEPALTRINLEVHAGDYVGVIGPNGGGKTTLLRTMLGLLTPAAGQVLLFGQPVTDFRAWSKIGYVPQKATSFDARFPVTVEEVVAMGRVAKLGPGRWMGRTDRQAVASALERVDMAGLRHRLIAELSGGQQQRIFIARALASEPELLVLDEPAVGIDIRSQDSFYQLLSRLNREHGLTLVMVSHDIDVVVNEVTHIACINETLVYHGAPKDFIKADYMTELYGKARKFIIHGH